MPGSERQHPDVVAGGVRLARIGPAENQEPQAEAELSGDFLEYGDLGLGKGTDPQIIGVYGMPKEAHDELLPSAPPAVLVHHTRQIRRYPETASKNRPDSAALRAMRKWRETAGVQLFKGTPPAWFLGSPSHGTLGGFGTAAKQEFE